MRRRMIVGFTPKKRIFGNYTEAERKCFDVANRFMTKYGVRVGSMVNVEFIDGVLVITRPNNFLNL